MAGAVDSRSVELSYIVSMGGILKRKHADQLRRRVGAVGDRSPDNGNDRGKE